MDNKLMSAHIGLGKLEFKKLPSNAFMYLAVVIFIVVAAIGSLVLFWAHCGGYF